MVSRSFKNLRRISGVPAVSTPDPTPSAPVSTVPPVIAGSALQGQLLSVTSTGTWSNSPTGFSYQWKRGASNIIGATSSTYSLVFADAGSTIACTVTATNGAGNTDADSNAIGPVVPLAPVDTLAPAISGTAVQGSLLSATTGTWSNSPTSYAYQWQRGGVSIPGAISATYLLVVGDIGANITCVVTATNAGGSTPATSNTIGPISSGGFSTLAAPTLGYPSPLSSNPTTIAIAIPGDWQTGDVLILARSASLAMSSPTLLTHTLTDADAAAGTISMGLSSVTLSGITYFQAYGQHGGGDSINRSNIVTWGDTTAPTISTSGTQSNTETQVLAVALTGSDTGGIASWSITGGADQLLFEISGTTLRWTSNGTQAYGTPLDQGLNNVYDVQVTATDYGGNATALNVAVTVSLADTTPDAFTFTDVTGATVSTVYTSNTITVAGLGSGINAAVSITGGTYSKNGGSYTSAAGTAVNGDTFAVRVTSSATGGIATNATLTIGTVTDTYSVTTSGADPSLDTTIHDPSYFTFSNSNKTALYNTPGGDISVVAVTSKSTGKWQWETTNDVHTANQAAGVIDASASTTGWPGTLASYFFVNGGLSGPGTPGGPYTSYGAGARLVHCLDMGAKKYWVGIYSGGTVTWQNGNPATPTGGVDISSWSGPVKAALFFNPVTGKQTVCLSAADQLASLVSGYSRYA